MYLEANAVGVEIMPFGPCLEACQVINASTVNVEVEVA